MTVGPGATVDDGIACRGPPSRYEPEHIFGGWTVPQRPGVCCGRLGGRTAEIMTTEAGPRVADTRLQRNNDDVRAFHDLIFNRHRFLQVIPATWANDNMF